MGTVKVYIDNVEQDSDSGTSGTQSFSLADVSQIPLSKIFQVFGLSAAGSPHTIKVEYESGTTVNFDYFEVGGGSVGGGIGHN